jgi:hypothetical protein
MWRHFRRLSRPYKSSALSWLTTSECFMWRHFRRLSRLCESPALLWPTASEGFMWRHFRRLSRLYESSDLLWHTAGESFMWRHFRPLSRLYESSDLERMRVGCAWGRSTHATDLPHRISTAAPPTARYSNHYVHKQLCFKAYQAVHRWNSCFSMLLC